MVPERAALTRSQRLSFIAIVVAATVLRLGVNDVQTFSPADETIYVDLSARLARDGFFSGYPATARTWVDNPRWWIYPSPLRFGYLALTTADRVLTWGLARSLWAFPMATSCCGIPPSRCWRFCWW